MADTEKPIRKRGKKHKKDVKSHVELQPIKLAEHEPLAEPSWIAKQQEDLDLPYGELDPDLKAYFRSVEVQLDQSSLIAGSLDSHLTENEVSASKLLLYAAVSEMQGKELTLATDPDGSKILERMVQFMDDGSRKLLMLALAGSYATLVQHLFASHVCQTLFKISPHVMCRELQGLKSEPPEFYTGGPLPPMKNIIISAANEILPLSASLISNPFGTHVIRDLLPILSAGSWEDMIWSQATQQGKTTPKKRGRDVVVSSIDALDFPTTSAVPIPSELRSMATRYLDLLQAELNPLILRNYALDKIANPCIQVLIKAEVDLERADRLDSILDDLIPGVVAGRDEADPLKGHFELMARDPAGSHLVQLVLSQAPESVFTRIWGLYVSPSLNTLATDPVANFVVATAVGRASRKQLNDVTGMSPSTWTDCVATRRIGLLRALVDRAAQLRTAEGKAIEVVLSAFGLASTEDHSKLVTCALALKSLAAIERLQPAFGTEVNMQGALLLQSVARLGEPHNAALCASVESFSVDQSVELAKSPISSHVLEAILESPSVPYRFKRQFALSFVGNFHLLAADRIASHVGDRLWALADPSVRERLVRPLMMHETELQATHGGRLFLKKACIWQLNDNPEAWKRSQADDFAAATLAAEIDKSIIPEDDVETEGETKPISSKEDKDRKRKRKAASADEIDGAFAGKKSKTKDHESADAIARPAPSVKKEDVHGPERSGLRRPPKPPADLDEVFRALANAP